MPPKRRGTTTAKAAPAAKRSRTSTDAAKPAAAAAEPSTAAAQEPAPAATTAATSKPAAPKKKKAAPNRWTIPSCSANIAAQYKAFLEDDKKDPFAFALMCDAPFSNGDSDDEEDEDEDEDDDDDDEEEASSNNNKNNDNGDKPKCDGGKKCYCTQLYDDHPEHPYVMTRAGKCMLIDLRSHCEIRDPDNFGMYTFNDHSAYGALEVLQNLILDFEEADSWQEKWAVCEAMGCFLKDNSYGTLASQIDDGEGADAIWQLMGRLFLSMLAQFERDGLLAKDGPVKNLGFIMAVWMSIPSDMRGYNLLEESMAEPLGPIKDKNVKRWRPHSFDKQILAYARKYDITLKGLHNLEELIEEIEGDGEGDLPEPERNTEKADVFHYKRNLTRYKQTYGNIPHFMSTHGKKKQTTPKSVMGGDNLDITSWTSAERKAAAYNKKDPLSKKELDMIKEGCVMSQG
ncbi:hypothetical protein B0T21DRAFT_388296 [Apiosordaria backusii]|uniref:Uncharacterized protein n=1 Tax=Apiosordaria backusii TaxID=314023 RepID=A0AA39ZPJ1_9PEZI|nr:hypothetical protein B0T21DRAFT_388296 [Apiosordaria backusii]